MQNKGLIRRNFLKRMLACSAAPMVGGTILSLSDANKWLDKNEKEMLEKSPEDSFQLRVAIFGYTGSGSHTYANVLKTDLENTNVKPVFFHDLRCILEAPKNQWGVYAALKNKAIRQKQLKEFRQSIARVENESSSAIFSFRAPFLENTSEMVQTLRKLNFRFVFVESSDLERVAGNWFLLVNAIERKETGSLPWRKSQRDWTYGQVNIPRDMADCFTERAAVIRHCQSLVKNDLILKIHPEEDLKIAKEFLGNRFFEVWREISFIGDPYAHIANADEVKAWLKDLALHRV